MSLFKEWQFTDTNQLMGLYGRVESSKIKAIGFITLDTRVEICPGAEETENGATETEESAEPDAEGSDTESSSTSNSTETTGTSDSSSSDNTQG